MLHPGRRVSARGRSGSRHGTSLGKWTFQRRFENNLDCYSNDFLDNLSSYKVGQYEAVNSQMIGYDGLSAGGLATTIVASLSNFSGSRAHAEQDEAPEPIKNAFDDPNAPPEEKTVAPVGPKNEVPMQQSTVIAPVDTVPADKPEDLRAPVGLDAGAPEVTDAAEDDGGWHGGAEEDQRRDIEEEAQVKGAPLGAKVEVQEMGLDEEAKKLVEAAMRDDEGM